MNQCHNCKAFVNADVKFCQYCAADLSKNQQAVLVSNSGLAVPARACSNCGATLKEDARYCANCAAPALGTASNRIPYDTIPSKRKALIISVVVFGILLIAGGIIALLLLTGAKPTKESAVQCLRDMYSALAAGNCNKALDLIQPGPGIGADLEYRTVKERCEQGKTVPITATWNDALKNIDLLVQRGTWGKLSDFGGKANAIEEYAKQFGVAADSLYALIPKEEKASAIFYWDGKQFRITSTNNIESLDRQVMSK